MKTKRKKSSISNGSQQAKITRVTLPPAGLLTRFSVADYLKKLSVITPHRPSKLSMNNEQSGRKFSREAMELINERSKNDDILNFDVLASISNLNSRGPVFDELGVKDYNANYTCWNKMVEHGMKEKLENQNILSKPPFNKNHAARRLRDLRGQQIGENVGQYKLTASVQQKVRKKQDEFMNIVEHFKNLQEKETIFGNPFLTKNNEIIKFYLSHKALLDPIIKTYTHNAQNAYKLLPPQIKQRIIFSKRQRALQLFKTTLAKFSNQISNGRIRSLSLYEKKNNYESMEINLQTNKLTHLIRGKSCCCKACGGRKYQANIQNKINFRLIRYPQDKKKASIQLRRSTVFAGGLAGGLASLFNMKSKTEEGEEEKKPKVLLRRKSEDLKEKLDFKKFIIIPEKNEEDSCSLASSQISSDACSRLGAKSCSRSPNSPIRGGKTFFRQETKNLGIGRTVEHQAETLRLLQEGEFRLKKHKFKIPKGATQELESPHNVRGKYEKVPLARSDTSVGNLLGSIPSTKRIFLKRGDSLAISVPKGLQTKNTHSEASTPVGNTGGGLWGKRRHNMQNIQNSQNMQNIQNSQNMHMEKLENMDNVNMNEQRDSTPRAQGEQIALKYKKVIFNNLNYDKIGGKGRVQVDFNYLRPVKLRIKNEKQRSQSSTPGRKRELKMKSKEGWCIGKGLNIEIESKEMGRGKKVIPRSRPREEKRKGKGEWNAGNAGGNTRGNIYGIPDEQSRVNNNNNNDGNGNGTGHRGEGTTSERSYERLPVPITAKGVKISPFLFPQRLVQVLSPSITNPSNYCTSSLSSPITPKSTTPHLDILRPMTTKSRIRDSKSLHKLTSIYTPTRHKTPSFKQINVHNDLHLNTIFTLNHKSSIQTFHNIQQYANFIQFIFSSILFYV